MNDYVTTRLRPNGIYEICLNAPANGNRFDVAGLNALKGAFVQSQGNGARAVLLTHLGEALCLGGNLGDARRQHAGTVQAFADALKSALNAIYDCPVPVACAIEGNAEGGGLSMVEACDLAVAAETARFAIPEILGDMPPVISFASASRVVPQKRLMRMALLGDALSAAEAEAMGLITAVVERGAAWATCMAWLDEIIAHNPAALYTIRALRSRMDRRDYAQRLDAAGDLLVGAMMHAETHRMLDRRDGGEP